METETIDKLFLELSQFTKAQTKRELMYSAAYDALAVKVDKYGLALMMIRHGCADPASVARKALEDSKPALADAAPNGSAPAGEERDDE